MSDQECQKCGRFYELREGYEPTPFCDGCAHAEADRLMAENASLKAQAALDTVRFREMQEAGTRLEADRDMIDWAEQNLICLYDGGGAYGIEFGPISTGTTKLEPFGTIREAIASAMQKEQAP